MDVRLSELAEMVGGVVEGDPQRMVTGVRPLESAGPNDLSFLSNPRYKDAARTSRAGVLLVGEADPDLGKDFLVVENPYRALAQILEVIHPATPPQPGIASSAAIDPTAEIDATASIGPFVVVGPRSRVGANAVLESQCVIGVDCSIGEESILHPRVVLYDRTEVGDRCILHAGVVLGSDGYGYAQVDGRHVKLHHLGKVVVEDEVEIGANSTVDRALLAETRIGAGSKIDNLVQVAHNVRLGKGCLLISQSGIAGSTRLGNGVVLAGQSGISGHLEIGDGVQIAAKSAVFKSVESGRTVAGIPAMDAGVWRRQQAVAAKLVELRRRVIELEKRLNSILSAEERRD